MTANFFDAEITPDERIAAATDPIVVLSEEIEPDICTLAAMSA
jgi:hypothetical protein